MLHTQLNLKTPTNSVLDDITQPNKQLVTLNSNHKTTVFYSVAHNKSKITEKGNHGKDIDTGGPRGPGTPAAKILASPVLRPKNVKFVNASTLNIEQYIKHACPLMLSSVN